MAEKIYIFKTAGGTIPADDLLGGYGESDIFTFPLSGVTDNQINLLGENRVVSTGETGDYATDFPVSAV